MQIVIAIRDIWARFEEESRALSNAGVSVKDVVRLAFGFSAMSCQSPIAPNHHMPYGVDVFTAVRNLVGERDLRQDRLPKQRQSVYGRFDPSVHRIVDIVGEISQMLTDAVIRQIGSFPPQLRLLRFIGHDLVLILAEEDSVHYRFA